MNRRQSQLDQLETLLALDRAIRTGRGWWMLRAIAECKPGLWEDARNHAVEMALDIYQEGGL